MPDEQPSFIYTQNRHLVTVIYNKFNDLNVIYDF